MRRRLRELAVLVAVGGLMMAGCSSSDKKASVTDAQGKNVAESQSQDEGSKKVTFVLKSLGSNYWVGIVIIGAVYVDVLRERLGSKAKKN